MSIPPWTLRNTHIESETTIGAHASPIGPSLRLNAHLHALQGCCPGAGITWKRAFKFPIFRLAAAALDGFDPEVPSADSPLGRLPNAFLTSRTAWYSEESKGEVRTKAVANIVEKISN